MSVHQTPNGRWYVVFWEQGKQRREYMGRGEGAHRLALARDLEIKRKKLLLERYKPKEGLTFKELAEMYLESKGRPRWLLSGLRPSLDAFGHKPCSRLSMRDLANMLAGLTCGPATRNRAAAYARAVLSFGLRYERVTDNPFRNFRPFRVPTPERRVFTLAEVRRLLDVAEGHLQRVIVLALYTISRPGPSELLRIKWRAVNWERNEITIPQGKTGLVKVVPLAPTLRRCLECWAKEAQSEFIIAYRSRPVTHFKRAWASALEAAEVPFRVPYTFRHTGITWMLDEGVSPAVVSRIAGHASITTTISHYYKSIPERHQDEDALGKLPQY